MAKRPQPIAALPEYTKLRNIITADASDDEAWEMVWREKVTPWDDGDIQPPLEEVIETGFIEFPRHGRALVPGCGSGYDVLYIAAALELETIGVDISPTAVEAANACARNASVPDHVAFAFAVQDFFSIQVANKERFDVIYDCLFFAAIHPDRRLEWGQQMNALINRGGYLITLVYPIDPPTDLGPPFFVRPNHYAEALGSGWEKVLDKVPENSTESHVGRERIIVWKKP